MQDRYTV